MANPLPTPQPLTPEQMKLDEKLMGLVQSPHAQRLIRHPLLDAPVCIVCGHDSRDCTGGSGR